MIWPASAVRQATAVDHSMASRFMATIKKLLDEHVASGDAKPAAISNGSSGQSFAPKPRGFTAMEDDNGFEVNQDFTQAWHRGLGERGGGLWETPGGDLCETPEPLQV